MAITTFCDKAICKVSAHTSQRVWLGTGQARVPVARLPLVQAVSHGAVRC
jgi:hypothetical protein